MSARAEEGVFDKIKRLIAENDEKERKKKIVASPTGVPPPPVVPVLEPGKIGFVANAEMWNSRASKRLSLAWPRRSNLSPTIARSLL